MHLCGQFSQGPSTLSACMRGLSLSGVMLSLQALAVVDLTLSISAILCDSRFSSQLTLSGSIPSIGWSH